MYRSVLTSEIHSLVLGFVVAYAIQHTMTEILGRNLYIEAYVDSQSVFEVMAKQQKTVEKRLKSDIKCLKESYGNGELSIMRWFPGGLNPADDMVKTR